MKAIFVRKLKVEKWINFVHYNSSASTKDQTLSSQDGKVALLSDLENFIYLSIDTEEYHDINHSKKCHCVRDQQNWAGREGKEVTLND